MLRILACVFLGLSALAAPMQEAGSQETLDQRIERLVAKLDVPDMNRSMDVIGPTSEGVKARDELVRIGKPAVPALLKALQDKSGWRRCYAIEALATLKEPSAIQPLIKIMQSDPDLELRPIAASHLGEFGSREPVKPLIEALKARSGRSPGSLASCAAESLAKIGDPISIEPIIRQLGSDDEWTHGPAPGPFLLGDDLVETVVSFGKQAVEPLARALKAPSWKARQRAAYALARLHDRRALPIMRRKIASGLDRHSVQAIAALAAPELEPILVRKLDSLYREKACNALSGYRTDSAAKAIAFRLARWDASDRYWGLHALAAMKRACVIPALKKLRLRADEDTRKHVDQVIQAISSR